MAIERFACLKEIKYNNRIHKHLPENSEKICYCVYKITRASKIAFCARAPHLRIPALVAARRILRAFGFTERHTCYACRSSSRKSFHRKHFRDCCGAILKP